MNCAKNSIIQYTTPTIEVNFKTIDPETITEAFLVFKLGPTVLLSLSNYTVTRTPTQTVPGGTISFTLTQAQSGALPLGASVKICCDWKLTDGTRGRSYVVEYMVAPTGKEEVI